VVSTWTDGYAIGQPVRVRHQGSWRRAQVCAIRGRSCMVVLVKSGEQTTANIHDPRNIEPCQVKSPSETSTSDDQLSFG
jgi:hypothetical protein